MAEVDPEEPETCGICNQVIDRRHAVGILNCMGPIIEGEARLVEHRFHVLCLKRRLSTDKQHECPTCRDSISYRDFLALETKLRRVEEKKERAAAEAKALSKQLADQRDRALESNRPPQAAIDALYKKLPTQEHTAYTTTPSNRQMLFSRKVMQTDAQRPTLLMVELRERAQDGTNAREEMCYRYHLWVDATETVRDAAAAWYKIDRPKDASHVSDMEPCLKFRDRILPWTTKIASLVASDGFKTIEIIEHRLP